MMKIAGSRLPPFPTVDKCSSDHRKNDAVAANLDGTLLRGRSSFPYFALVAYDTGGPLRLLLLLLLSPLAAFLYHLVSEAAGIRVLIFAALAGARLSSIESAARAVLPKFYAEDVHPETWRVFSACGSRRCIVTANPRIMVEAFCKEYLGADVVMGTELGSCVGRATGLVSPPGVLVGENKASALERVFEDSQLPDIGLGDRSSDFPFMKLCKEAYVVPTKQEETAKLPKQVIFHDGRLVRKPTPVVALFTVIWIPLGFLLACLRIAAAALLPTNYLYFVYRALGVEIIVKGTQSTAHSGVLFVSSHRTLFDPAVIAIALRRPVFAVTYSLSCLSEFLSPIKTVRLTRDRTKDAHIIKSLLKRGDLVVCPEGTTCREPYLLRFSALFAELSNDIIPVGMVNRTGMFHGTTARGWKGMDPFYFFMNPRPVYEVTFLERIPEEMTCGGGCSSHDVANYVQMVIAAKLRYVCTGLTRKDKYMALAGNDGTIAQKPGKLTAHKYMVGLNR